MKTIMYRVYCYVLCRRRFWWQRNAKSSWEGKGEKKSQLALTDPLNAAALFIDLCGYEQFTKKTKDNSRQLFPFQPAKILEEKKRGAQFPNPQIGPDSLCVHRATLLNQRPRISNGSQSRRSKIASAAPSVGKSFSNMELQRTYQIE